MREHLPAAQRFATRLTGDPASAEDLMQDALRRAHRGWASFRGDASPRTWLFQIVLNAFRDHLRSREARSGQGAQDRTAATAPVAGDFEDPAAPNPARQLEGKELSEIVAHEVSNLPPRQREVLLLIAYEHVGTAEAAAMLGMTEQNVRTTLHHARQRLRQRLASYLGTAARERS